MKSTLTNRFHEIRNLKTSGSRTVFLASDRVLERPEVLVKVFRRGSFKYDLGTLGEFLSWYGGISHPHLTRVLDAGLTSKNDLYFVREYLPTSRDLFTPDTEWIHPLLATVSFLHSRGRIHGAIKPSNLFVHSDSLQLTDPQISPSSDLTGQDIRFTAPEVLLGGVPTFASDLYSIGAILYRALSGQYPFDDFDLVNLRSKYIWAFPRPLSNVCHVSKAISDVVAQLLDKEPESRISAFDVALRLLGVNPVGVHRAPCLGRESEIQAIHTAIEKSSARGLRVILLNGEAGFGKTRLIEELQLRANFRQSNVEIIRCAEATGELAAVLNGVRSLLKRRTLKKGSDANLELGNFSPTLSSMLSIGNEKLNNSQFPLERVISDLVGFLGRLGRAEQLTLVIDDLERADPTTKEFIETLCHRAAEVPAALILTGCFSDGGFGLSKVATDCLGDSCTHIRLRSLGLTDSQSLLEFFSPPTESRNQILRDSSGNPLLIEEYAKCAGKASGKVPPKIASIARQVMATLNRETRLVAQVISLFEKPVEIDVVTEICGGSSEVLQVCRRVLAFNGITEETGTNIVIKYAYVRRRIYAAISRRRIAQLNMLAYQVLKPRGADLETLAHLAFKAHMFHEAWSLFQVLAGNSYDAKDFSSAAKFFERMEECTANGTSFMPPFDKFNMARCYSRLGRQAVARRICEDLLSGKTTKNDPLLISSVCAELAGPYHANSASNRIRLHTHAINVLPTKSPALAQRYVQLSTAFIRKGDLGAAAEALAGAEMANLSSGSSKDLRPAQAHLLINRGDFRGAVECLETISAPDRQQAPIVLNNIAYCLEHLGNLRKAKEIQSNAHDIAKASGYVPIQVLSLGNFGSIETKFGNMDEATRLFRKAFEVLGRFSTRDKEFPLQIFSTLPADAALYSIQISDYKSAVQFLKKITPNPDSRMEMDNIYIGLIRCELALEVGQTAKCKALLQSITGSEVSRIDFFRVERLILESRLQCTSIKQSILNLKEAVEISERLGTLHQHCRALNELTEMLISAGHAEDALPYVDKTLEIAKENGYRPIRARSLLLKALASKEKEEGRAGLFAAFYMASEIGLPSLAAEIAFHIGTSQMEIGQYTAAREYLIRSVSLTDHIVAGLPVSWRKGYLENTCRDKASALLEDCIKKTHPSLMQLGEAGDEIGIFFKAAYRLTVSAKMATNTETLVNSLLQTLEISFDRPAVVMIEESAKKTWRSVRIKLSEELTKRVASLCERAQNRIYFGSAEKTRTRDTVAWIPLRSRQHGGGIYVTCFPGGPPFSEREMEFLTILGTIVGGALEQIESRQVEGARAGEVSEFHGIIGASKAIREVYSQIEIAAGNSATVLIEGESGTGKELVAKAIHEIGQRSKNPFIAVDCGAIPETLIEAELFGAKKGAYTDAVADRPGLFEAADRGTIFLDEISNTSPAVQAKLLRVLQEREVRRIGETRGRTVDVRLIAATNSNLDTLAQEGRFRKDLLYRLKVLHITVPPLRNRREDISMLAHAFLERLNNANKTKKQFAHGVVAQLSTHPFPGNVRELQNAVERAFFLARGSTINQISLETQPDAVSVNEVQSWFQEIVEGRKNFWSAVHNRYKERDIPREKVVALVDLGLRTTRGSYKGMASMFHLKGAEYRRFMDFLRRNKCLLDFRPYRKASAESS